MLLYGTMSGSTMLNWCTYSFRPILNLPLYTCHHTLLPQPYRGISFSSCRWKVYNSNRINKWPFSSGMRHAKTSLQTSVRLWYVMPEDSFQDAKQVKSFIVMWMRTYTKDTLGEGFWTKYIKTSPKMFGKSPADFSGVNYHVGSLYRLKPKILILLK